MKLLPPVIGALALFVSPALAAVETGIPSGQGRGQVLSPPGTYHPYGHPYGDMAAADRLLDSREYGHAILVLERVVARDATSEKVRGVAYNLKGLSLYMVGRYAEAIDDFTASLEIQERIGDTGDRRWKTVFNRGLAHEAAKDLHSAANDFVRAYAMAPHHPRVQRKIFNFFNKE